MSDKKSKNDKLQSNKLDADLIAGDDSDGNRAIPITTPDGEELVLITREAYDRLVELARLKIEEMADDAQRALEAANEDKVIPHHIAKRLASGDEHPLKIWREYRGMTQADLAEVIGSKPDYLAQIEDRKAKGLTSLLKSAALVLRVSVDDLIE